MSKNQHTFELKSSQCHARNRNLYGSIKHPDFESCHPHKWHEVNDDKNSMRSSPFMSLFPLHHAEAIRVERETVMWLVEMKMFAAKNLIIHSQRRLMPIESEAIVVCENYQINNWAALRYRTKHDSPKWQPLIISCLWKGNGRCGV